MMYYIQQVTPIIPYVIMGISAFQAARAKDKQDKIIHMLWINLALMIAIADAVVK